MKRLKRIMALVIAMAMVLSMMSMAAFAANTNPNPENDPPTSTGDVSGSITVQNPQTVDGTASTYKAYKIFDVTYADGATGVNASEDLYAYTITDDPDNNNDWFSLITGSGDMTQDGNVWTGKANTAYEGLTFTKTAGDANKYTVEATSAFSAPEFAKALRPLSANATVDANFTDGVANKLDLGYWFVTTTTGSLCNLTTTHPNEIIYDKNEVPQDDKSIVENGTEVKNNNAAIGDVIQYQINTKVPSMVGYDKYYFIVKDTFDKGLTLVDAKDATSKAGSVYYAADNTDKYFEKNYIKVELAAGNPATANDNTGAAHPAKTLTRVYLHPTNKDYYKDSALQTRLTQTTYDSNGKRTARTLTQDAIDAGYELDDDLNLKYCYYVNVIDIPSDNYVVHDNMAGNYNPAEGVDSSERDDIAPTKGQTRMEIVFVDMLQYLDQTNGTTTNTTENYNQTQEGTLGSADQYTGYTGSAIKITYFAEVDEDAVVSDGGNLNTSKITYSNDPTETGSGSNTPDEPDSHTPTGDTPQSVTNTFVTGIKLTKISAEDTTKKLAGAQFELKATNLLNTVIQNGVRYEEAGYTLKKVPATAADGVSQDATSDVIYAKEQWADGTTSETYYKLKDGTYTTTAPTAANVDPNLYEDTSKTYVKVRYTWVVPTGYKEDGTTLTPANKHIATTGEDGIVSFAGLKAGTYTLTELVAPDGYNMLKGDITVEISVAYKDNNDGDIAANSDTATAAKGVWTATISGPGFDSTTIELAATTEDEQAHSQDVLKLLAFEVENSQGTLLPSTGGIGTTIFYVVGAMLVIGAGVILITRRRMDA